MILLEAHDFGVPLTRLVDALDRPATPAARQALLLALEPYRAPASDRTSEADRAWRLLQSLARGESQVERSAALWVLGRWQTPLASEAATIDHATVAPLSDAELAAARGLPQPDEGRDWWMTSQGHTMKMVPAPVTFQLGPAEGERVYEATITSRRVTIPRSFAASVYEVTQEQYLRFRPEATFAQDVALHQHGPANKVSFVDAMQYCRWLSEQEGIAEEQMCYPPVAEIGTADGTLDAERRSRTGYRLLTEDEWEYVCRAGAATPWFCGVDESHLGHFSRYALTADEHLWPVGSLRPNAMGLFDIAGNVGEWCHPLNPHPDTYPLRGGAYDFPARRNRSAEVYMHSNSGFSYTGIRVGRTLPAPW
jgi:eukaryotic-like serine/threonine-protein kinase